MNNMKVLINGIVKENPTFVLLLGMCPTLGTTSSAINGMSMGLATMFVLILSNFIISLIKNLVPDMVRIPSYIVVIASLVTILQMVMQAYVPDIYATLGLFIPLIVVNCIILGRAEAYANKNPVPLAAFDGIGMGIGYTLTATVMACIRELLGSGTIFGATVTAGTITPFTIMIMAPGGFFVFGCLIALVNKITKGKVREKRQNKCMGCPGAAFCSKVEEGGCEE